MTKIRQECAACTRGSPWRVDCKVPRLRYVAIWRLCKAFLGCVSVFQTSMTTAAPSAQRMLSEDSNVGLGFTDLPPEKPLKNHQRTNGSDSLFEVDYTYGLSSSYTRHRPLDLLFQCLDRITIDFLLGLPGHHPKQARKRISAPLVNKIANIDLVDNKTYVG